MAKWKRPGSKPTEVASAPLAEWQIFYFRNDSWTNPMSSAAQGGTQGGTQRRSPFGAGSAGVNAARATAIPDGVRLILDLPPGRALAGRITRDWVNPIVGGGKS